MRIPYGNCEAYVTQLVIPVLNNPSADIPKVKQELKDLLGFDDDEIGQLELYLKGNLGELKKQAASVNPIKAMMED